MEQKPPPTDSGSEPKTIAPGSTATNPGRLSVSMELLKTFHPFLATGDATAFPEDAKAWAHIDRDIALLSLREHVEYGDCRGALVVEAREDFVVVAAYSDDLDACVFLTAIGETAKTLFHRHALRPGTRLICANTYMSVAAEDIPAAALQGHSEADADALMNLFEKRRRELLQRDIVLGDAATPSPFYGFWPIIVDFISEDHERLDQLRSSISLKEWQRIGLLAKSPSLYFPRNIAPWDSEFPNQAPKMDDITVHMTFLFKGGKETRADDVKRLLMANFSADVAEVNLDTIFQTEHGAVGFLRIGDFSFTFLEIDVVAPNLDLMVKCSPYAPDTLLELQQHTSHMNCSCSLPPGRIKDQMLGMIHIAHGLTAHGLVGVILTDAWQCLSRKVLRISSEEPTLTKDFEKLGFMFLTGKVPFQAENGVYLATKGNHLFGMPDLVIWVDNQEKILLAANAIDSIKQYLLSGSRINPGDTMTFGSQLFRIETAPPQPELIRGPGKTLMIVQVVGPQNSQPSTPSTLFQAGAGMNHDQVQRTPDRDDSQKSRGPGCAIAAGAMTAVMFTLFFLGVFGNTWKFLGFAAGLILGLITIAYFVAYLFSHKK